MNGNLSLARDVKGAKQHGPENQLLMEPLIPKTRSRRSALAICIFTMFLTFLYVFAISPDSAILKGKIFQSNSTQLQVFQVYKPVPSEPPHKVPGDGCNTELLLMRHEFGFSYGHPFVGKFSAQIL